MSENLDPHKFVVWTPKAKKMVTLLGVFIAIVVFPLFTYVYYTLSVNRPSQTDREVTFEIKKGDSVTDIAGKLSEEGAVNSGFVFASYILMHRLDRNVQAGVYTIRAGSTVKELAELFQHGKDDLTITFIEGWRVEEMAREAAAVFYNVKYEDFVAQASGLEGYLFPDTYYFNRSITTEDLLLELKETFAEKTAALLTESNLEKAGLTKGEAIVLASVVEREAAKAEDKPIIAGILYNRLKSEELLGADATVQYAVAFQKNGCRGGEDVCPGDDYAKTVDWWPKVLTADDLASESPYNTRKYVGLPPAPISSFGAATLGAVLNHTNTPYKYYLTDSEGVMHYATTLDQHNANVKKYLTD